MPTDLAVDADLDVIGQPDAPVLSTRITVPSESLTAWVVVDSLVDATAMGGTRMTESVTEQEVRELARAMSVKLGLVGLPIGGAKAGIRAVPQRREQVLRAFGRSVAPLLHGGVYLGCDLGTTHADRDLFFAEARYAIERNPRATRMPVDWTTLWQHMVDITGFGVAAGAVAALATRTSRDGSRPGHRRVVVQGFGTVGRAVAKTLVAEGHRVVGIADVVGTIADERGLPVEQIIGVCDSAGTVDRSRLPDGVTVSSEPEAWLDIDTDLLVLAAAGDAIRDDNVDRVRASLVVEGGNLCLTPSAQRRLRASGRTVIPGTVVNVGGAAVAGCVLTGTAPSGLSLPQLCDWLFSWVGDRICRNTRDLLEIGAGRAGDPVPELLAARRAEGRA